jgi:3-deoxy-D-manno-octulosonic-acid transferase
MRWTRLIYNLAFPLVLLALLPAFLWRMIKRGKYRHKFGQRLGIYSARVAARLRARRWTWVHAVSVGEVLIALKLIRRLREREPDRHFVLSTTTSTGFALTNENRCEWIEPIYNPIDFLWIIRRALGVIRPEQLILVEAEVWPNLAAEAKAAGISIVLVNARLSPRSESRYRRFRAVTAPVFNLLNAVCVQEPEDVARWKSLGVHPSRIHHTGSIKFDDSLTPSSAPRDFRPLLDRFGVTGPVLLGGSTHRGEERILAETFRDLRRDFPDLFLIVAPRHVERSAEVAESLAALGLSVVSRSAIPQPTNPPDALLIDTTGELRDWYRCADVVFIGKSLSASGGQNPAEAVAAGKAVVLGPNMQNFALLVRSLVEHDGAVQIADSTGLRAAIATLLRDADRRVLLAHNGAAVIESHRGATDRTCTLLAELRRS